MNCEAVDFLRKLGFSRVILDRHLTIDEISEIAQRSKEVEIEVFIHGGGCSNLNGSCYLYHFRFPAMNRAHQIHHGLVKTPCTLPFDIYDLNNEQKRLGSIPVMDAYETCSICKLPELAKSGVTGFKIEGRGDNVWYQESETKVYRELIDLLASNQTELFKKKLHALLEDSRNFDLHPNLPSLKEYYCEQRRCYYSSLVHVPYKLPVAWRSWTKAQFAEWRVQG
jgi:collagenase-like PrtC family protease